MWASEGARVDALRDKIFRLCGTSRWSTDQLREALLNSSNDVNKAADALAAKVPKMPETDSEPPSTPPGLRTPAKPSFIMADTVALTSAPVVVAPPVAPVVRVGVGVVVRNPSDGKILVGERYGSHGANKLAFPGGHLEMNESWEECARREVYEETGLQLGPITHAATTNDPMPAEGKHYITIFMQADARAGQTPVNLEPHKCKGWKWMSWEEIVALPADRMFIPFQRFVETKVAEEEAKQGVMPTVPHSSALGVPVGCLHVPRHHMAAVTNALSAAGRSTHLGWQVCMYVSYMRVYMCAYMHTPTSDGSACGACALHPVARRSMRSM